MEQQLQQLQLAFISLLCSALVAFGLFIRNNLALRTKFNELNLKVAETDLDSTAMKNKIAIEAQAMIQKVFSEQTETIRNLQDELRHQRDLIDQGASERAKLEAQKDDLEKSLAEARLQQAENMRKLATMETHVQQLKDLTAENITLKGQIAELRQKIEDAEIKADKRHEELSRISNENFDLVIKLKEAEKLLSECKTLVAHYELTHPEIKKSDVPTG